MCVAGGDASGRMGEVRIDVLGVGAGAGVGACVWAWEKWLPSAGGAGWLRRWRRMLELTLNARPQPGKGQQ
jgi:hypothetical protein